MAILAYIRAIVLVLSMFVFLLLYAVSRIVLPHNKETAFALRRRWISWVCLPVLNIKVEVHGKPVDGAALYVCNHRSLLDPAIISKYLDAFVIAKAEIADYPLINKGAEVTGVIWVRRDSRDSRAATRQAYVDTIRDGYNVLVYPEGTISVDKQSLPFKRGTFNEAAKQGFAVVPMALEYRDASDLWTVHSMLTFFVRQCSKWRIETKLTFGPAIESTDGSVLHDKAETWVNEEMSRMQANWSRAWQSKSEDQHE